MKAWIGGEFADILLHDTDNRILVGIEVKYRSDWRQKKDIETNAGRLQLARRKLDAKSVVQCLLVSELKWNRFDQKSLLEDRDRPIAVIHWEQLGRMSGNTQVKEYLARQLEVLAGRNRHTTWASEIGNPKQVDLADADTFSVKFPPGKWILDSRGTEGPAGTSPR